MSLHPITRATLALSTLTVGAVAVEAVTHVAPMWSMLALVGFLLVVVPAVVFGVCRSWVIGPLAEVSA